jgi:hypothetical protein
MIFIYFDYKAKKNSCDLKEKEKNEWSKHFEKNKHIDPIAFCCYSIPMIFVHDLEYHDHDRGAIGLWIFFI